MMGSHGDVETARVGHRPRGLSVSALTVAAEMGTGAKVEDVDALALSATPASGLSTGYPSRRRLRWQESDVADATGRLLRFGCDDSSYQ
jgi:hypothetical protein